MNTFSFIREIRCGYEKSESYNQIYEISNHLHMSGTICKEHVQKLSQRFWLICGHFYLDAIYWTLLMMA